MNIKKLAEGRELPPCFKAECQYVVEWKDKEDPIVCGWKGRVVDGGGYVVGYCAPIDPYEDFSLAPCPKCKKSSYLVRLFDKESCIQRFRWSVDKMGKVAGRGESDLFPCSCKHYPSCILEGEVELKIAHVGDSFISDRTWLRIMGSVKCTGCYAKSKIAILERHVDTYEFSQFIREQMKQNRNS
jgi:hypothetical protein